MTPGQKMGALPGSSARGLGYLATAAGLKYIPVEVASPLIRGRLESRLPVAPKLAPRGLPRMSLIPCGVPRGNCAFIEAMLWALKDGLCRA